MITPQEALNRLLENNEIFHDEMTDLMRQIMQGQVSPEVIAAILIGLRVKVETVSEITAAANVLKEFSLKVPVKEKENLVDIVGTGGDGYQTFNISTTSMFVAAAAGAKVAKHGGKAVSSKSGAADIIETMGASIDLTPEQLVQSLEKINIAFMYAPKHHETMRYVAPIRKALGVRTIFNILGPLTNPAGAKNQLLGVFHRDLLGICIHALKDMEMSHVMVVNGIDGLDEITITGPTYVSELKNGVISSYEIHPEEYGIHLIQTVEALKADSIKTSLSKMDAVLNGEKGPCRDIVLLNSAAALYCAGVAKDLKEGMEQAKESIDSQKAKLKKEEFIALTNNIHQSKKG